MTFHIFSIEVDGTVANPVAMAAMLIWVVVLSSLSVLATRWAWRETGHMQLQRAARVWYRLSQPSCLGLCQHR